MLVVCGFNDRKALWARRGWVHPHLRIESGQVLVLSHRGVEDLGPLCPRIGVRAGPGHFPRTAGEPLVSAAPGIPRSHRIACSRPFRWTKGAVGIYAANFFRAASFRSMPRPGLSVRVMVPLWGMMCSP